MSFKDSASRVLFVISKPQDHGLLHQLALRLRQFQAPYSERRAVLILGDTLAFLVAQFALFLWLNQSSSSSLAGINASQSWMISLFCMLSWYMLAWLNDLYHIRSSYQRSLTLRRILFTITLAIVLFTAVNNLFTQPVPGSTFILLYVIITTPLIILWRMLYTVLSKILTFQHRVLIIGRGRAAHAITQVLKQETFIKYEIVGYLSPGKAATDLALSQMPWLGKVSNLAKVTQSYSVDEIVVAKGGKIKTKLFNALVECQANGIHVSWMPELYENLRHRIPIQHIDPGWALYAMQNRAVFRRLQLALKRVIDLGLVVFSLPMLLMLIPFIAIVIKLDSPGPIFYRQIRCGRAGEPFKIFKFRTMYTNAEGDGKARWAKDNDPRITRIGRILRKSRLDELPQVINILIGNMSFVGPRPERPEFVSSLESKISFYRTRLMVKPGLTGWAQVHYDYGNTEKDALMKLQYDFYYLRYWSIWLDLYILFRTVGVVFQLKGK